MEKYVMNKNVLHNKVSYAKGQEIGQGDEGFEILKNAGHVDVLAFKDASASQAPATPAASQAPNGGDASANGEGDDKAAGNADDAEEKSAKPRKPGR